MTSNSFRLMIFSASLCFLISCSSQKTAANESAPKTERKGKSGKKLNGKKGRPTFAKLLTKMDANKDGKLSKSEAEGPLKNDFGKIDANNDGFITKEEFNSSKPSRGPRQ